MDYLKRRILISIVVFFVAVNLDFIIPRLVPGNAAEIFASGTKLPSQVVQILTVRFGLNQPVYVQYFLFMKGIFATWPPFFGISYAYYPTPVTELIAARLPWTLLIIGISLFLSFQLGYWLTAISVRRRGGKFEFGSLYASIFFWSTPAFWIGMILLWVFGVDLGWLPQFGLLDFHPGTGLAYALSALRHMILPVATLTLIMFGQTYFLLRGASQVELKTDYVLSAKARGLKDRTISTDYVLRNSLLPVVSLIGYALATMISVDVMVEAVFGYTGVGDLVVDALLQRDYPVLEGSFFVLTTIVIVGGLLADFLLVRLDPRLRK